jgi:hypothetical protein
LVHRRNAVLALAKETGTMKTVVPKSARVVVEALDLVKVLVRGIVAVWALATETLPVVTSSGLVMDTVPAGAKIPVATPETQAIFAIVEDGRRGRAPPLLIQGSGTKPNNARREKKSKKTSHGKTRPPKPIR